MSVTTSNVLAGPFTCNGSTTAFTYPNYIVLPQHLQVNLVTSGVVTSLVYTTDWTFSGTADTRLGTYLSGGTVTTNSTYLAGNSIVISRRTPRTQASQIQINDLLRPETVENALDKLTAILQEDGLHLMGYADSYPSTTSGYVQDDFFYRRNAVAGGTRGWVLVGGVWKALPNIAS